MRREKDKSAPAAFACITKAKLHAIDAKKPDGGVGGLAEHTGLCR